uniref:Alanine--tRNA ligase n=1 Tax=candidate division WOR-3 bacterium TaxID=2052148 RepID=A0A7C3YZC1_UNCW3
MNAKEIRKTFLEFYAQRGHTIVPSSSLNPKDDPTLLFTTAGMVQFKPLWAGTKPLPYRRATSIQKCLRVSDLDKVGKSPKYLTFFEMLGNFSFGDYFKEEAIVWAWEYLLKVVGLKEEKLSVSVFREDEEAYQIWQKIVGLPEYKIFRLGEEDNFWGPAGGQGACGPCSEIYYDLGEEFGCGKTNCGPGCSCDRFLELYNLVFPQYDCQLDGRKLPLKNRGIDTGMGLERLAMVSQNKKSVFETDCFSPIIRKMAENLNLEITSENRVAFNICADHIRAVVFAIADGILPSPEERGYVIRSLIRRALLFAYKILKIEEPFLYQLSSAVVDLYHYHYPEVKESSSKASAIIKSEEERFLLTLATGMRRWEEIKGYARNGIISGEDAFRLSDTYGLSIEIQEELAKEDGLSIDREGFERCLAEQRQKSRKEVFVSPLSTDSLKGITQEFFGYEKLSGETELLHYERINGDEYEIFLAQTPFYAEAGGQVGDTGWVEGTGFKLAVTDSYYKFGLYTSRAKLIQGEIKRGKVFVQVDEERRREIERAHTATHLLHRALRLVLGEEVRQEGSLVEPGRLRFDFNFPRPLTKEEIKMIEEIIYEKIIEDLPVEKFFNLPINEAKAMGAIALFSETYGERVNVIKISDFSKELCGGTHLRRTGEIGCFRIISETGVAAGIRRISALCGKRAKRAIDEEQAIIENLEKEFGPKSGILKKVSEMKEIIDTSQKRNERLSALLLSFLKKEILPEKIGEISLIFGDYPYLTINDLRNLSDETKNREKTVAVFLTGEEEKRFVIRVSSDLTPMITARELASFLGKRFMGGGGGRMDLAEGGLKGKKEEIKMAIKDYLQKRYEQK